MLVPPVPHLPPLVVKRGTTNKSTHDEMLRRAKWNTDKKSSLDGLSHRLSVKPLARVGIFVLEKVNCEISELMPRHLMSVNLTPLLSF